MTYLQRKRIQIKLERASRLLREALELAEKDWPECIGFASGEAAGITLSIIKSQEIRDQFNSMPPEEDCIHTSDSNNWDCGAW